VHSQDNTEIVALVDLLIYWEILHKL